MNISTMPMTNIQCQDLAVNNSSFNTELVTAVDKYGWQRDSLVKDGHTLKHTLHCSGDATVLFQVMHGNRFKMEYMLDTTHCHMVIFLSIYLHISFLSTTLFPHFITSFNLNAKFIALSLTNMAQLNVRLQIFRSFL